MASLLTRRLVLQAASLLPIAGLIPAFAGTLDPASAPPVMRFGPSLPFNFAHLSEMAKALAAEPFAKAVIRHGDRLQEIDFDNHNKIRFRSDAALFGNGPGSFPVEMFHPGRYFQEPVGLYLVDNGQAREVLFDPSFFSYGESPVLEDLPADLGFAGFRVLGGKGQPDWLAFLGASYFRSGGESGQFGMSVRGIAIDTALAKGEEFPRFTNFWLEEPGDGSVIISALLDGPSLAGAFRIRAAKPKAVLMDVECVLYPRRKIERLGVAPLTSMFWYSDSSRRGAIDWRPQVHDSDGLALWTGADEHIWRPINNPPSVQTSTFLDESPKGFGLLQRNRDFANYQDDGVFYERRPCVWVEPVGDWGAGAVQLVEIPTNDEIHDNIVAYWVPEKPVEAGSEWRFAYKLTWADQAPIKPPLAQVIATRLGIAGIPGQPQVANARKFVIDFAGGPLDQLTRDAKVTPVIDVGHGEAKSVFAIPVIGTGIWRAFFDFHGLSEDPVDMRLYLALDGETLSETWLFQFLPNA